MGRLLGHMGHMRWPRIWLSASVLVSLLQRLNFCQQSFASRSSASPCSGCFFGSLRCLRAHFARTNVVNKIFEKWCCAAVYCCVFVFAWGTKSWYRHTWRVVLLCAVSVFICELVQRYKELCCCVLCLCLLWAVQTQRRLERGVMAHFSTTIIAPNPC